MSYFNLLRRKPAHILFGASLTFLSGFGQTFLLSLFVPWILATYHLGTGQFGLLYSGATLTSSMLLLWKGPSLDHRPVWAALKLTLAGLALSSLLLAITPPLILLFVAIIGLRFFGQGMMSHISLTVMSRYFVADRGKAISLSALGYSVGEMILPAVVTAGIAFAGWRWVLAASSIFLLAIVLPLCRSFPLDDMNPIQDHQHLSQLKANPLKRRRLLYLPQFWIVAIPASLVAFAATGVFIYQLLLVEAKGWNPAWFAFSFALYGASRFCSSLLSGTVIDRITARSSFPFVLFPFSAGLYCLAFWSTPAVAVVYFLLMGISMGGSNPIYSAVLVELFGSGSIATVRSMYATVMVISTALAPIIFGTLLDLGFVFEHLMLGLGALMTLTGFLSFYLWRLSPLPKDFYCLPSAP